MLSRLELGPKSSRATWLIAGFLAIATLATTARATPPRVGLQFDEEDEARLLQLDLAITTRKTAGSKPIDLTQAGELRGKAAAAAKKLRKEQIPSGPTTFGGAWTQLGPNPIVQVLRSS